MGEAAEKRLRDTARLAALIAVSVAALALPSAASAAVTVSCSYSGVAGTNLDIDVTGDNGGGPTPFIVVATTATDVDVSAGFGVFGVNSSSPVACSPDNTNLLTDIAAITYNDASTGSGNTLLVIDERVKRFEPGNGDEGGGTQTNEIEWAQLLFGTGSLDFLAVLTPTGVTGATVRAGDVSGGVGGDPGVNLNNDSDIDVQNVTGLESLQLLSDFEDSGTNSDVLTADGTGGVGQAAFAEPLGIEASLAGYAGNDTLIGGSRNDVLFGYGGNDTVAGGAGNDAAQLDAPAGTGTDSFDGGSGTADRIDYSNIAGPIAFDLGITAQQDTGGGGLDTVTGTESLTGSAGADTLIGDGTFNSITDGPSSSADMLFGRGSDDQLTATDGNDVLTGGPGDDALNGGADADTVSYAQDSTGPVTLNMSAGTHATGGAGVDTFTGLFDNLVGTPFAGDVITGNALANFIDVRDGNADTVTCLAPGPPPPADSVRGDLPGVDSIGSDCETLDLLMEPVIPGVGGGGGGGGSTTNPPATKKKCKKGRKLKRGKCVKKKRKK